MKIKFVYSSDELHSYFEWGHKMHLKEAFSKCEKNTIIKYHENIIKIIWKSFPAQTHSENINMIEINII